MEWKRGLHVLHELWAGSPMPTCPPRAAPAAKCAQLSAQVGAAQAEAATQLDALKEGLARELRRQRVRAWLPGRACRAGPEGPCKD